MNPLDFLIGPQDTLVVVPGDHAYTELEYVGEAIDFVEANGLLDDAHHYLMSAFRNQLQVFIVGVSSLSTVPEDKHSVFRVFDTDKEQTLTCIEFAKHENRHVIVDMSVVTDIEKELDDDSSRIRH